MGHNGSLVPKNVFRFVFIQCKYYNCVSLNVDGGRNLIMVLTLLIVSVCVYVQYVGLCVCVHVLEGYMYAWVCMLWVFMCLVGMCMYV